MSIDFDKVVEHYSSMLMMVHGNYFDVVMEENLLVAIQTNSNEQIPSKNNEELLTFFSICV